jgi:glutamate-1-semialdehyde 2,1-aminomutase
MRERKYAISKWPDHEEILKKLNALVERPMVRIKPERAKEYEEYFAVKCRKSRAMTDRAKAFIPGGVQHNLAFNYPFPLAMAKAEGAYLYDIDGNRYIDFLQAGGPTLLGSNY